MYQLEDIMNPVWDGKKIFRETFAMIEENGSCEAPFLFQPKQIIRVESYDGLTEYEEDKDWYVEDGRFIRTEHSRIPSTDWGAFYYVKQDERLTEQEEEVLQKTGLPPIRTTDGRYADLGNLLDPQYISKWVITVTYTTGEVWSGYKPVSMIEQLPKVYRKLKDKEPVTIVLYGDSICCGYDCSGLYHIPPYQPIWPELLCDSLRSCYSGEIKLINPSVGGMNSDWAIENFTESVVRHQPDLVILGFGMNDRCPGEEYAHKTKLLQDLIRRDCPEAEFVLIATSIPNTLLKTDPLNFYSHQEEYAKALKPLCKEGIILADIQNVQRVIMGKKRYIDIAGNNLNHPNDYFARIHAQILAVLLKPSN